MLLQTKSTFLCNEKYCPIELYPFTQTYFHQGVALNILGVVSIRGRLLLEGGFYWKKYGNVILSYHLRTSRPGFSDCNMDKMYDRDYPCINDYPTSVSNCFVDP